MESLYCFISFANSSGFPVPRSVHTFHVPNLSFLGGSGVCPSLLYAPFLVVMAAFIQESPVAFVDEVGGLMPGPAHETPVQVGIGVLLRK